MNKPLLAILLLLFSIQLWAQEAPTPPTTPAVPESAPVLSVAKAAELAQAKIEEMKLPPDHFIRAIIYVRANERDTAHYTVFYTPGRFKKTVPSRPVDGAPTEKSKTIIQSLRIEMDGTCTAIEEVSDSPSEGTRRRRTAP